MICQHKITETGYSNKCQKEATHKTKSSNRGWRYYCEEHAKNNYKRLLSKKNGRFRGFGFNCEIEVAQEYKDKRS